MKSLAIFLSVLIYSQLALADKITLKFTPQKEIFQTRDLVIEQIQAKMRCHFTKNGRHLYARRYPRTIIKKLNNDQYEIKIVKSKLKERPYKAALHSCAYVLIVLGDDLNGRSLVGDIVLMGQMNGQMTAEEFEEMSNSETASLYLGEMLRELKLTVGQTSRGRRIVRE
jgi:hypothetical protein